jgi:hypothetical protein
MTKQQKQEAARRNAALLALVEVARGYGTATPAQVAQVAAEHDMEPWDLEGMYFDATETAGEQ